MKKMKVSRFADVVGTPSGLANQLDADGSSQDMVFAAAIVANEPTSILEEAGIVTVQTVPEDVDEARFPIFRNTQFTWVPIDGRATGSSLGSDFAASGLNRVEYRLVRPITQTANIFLPDEVSLLNRANFDLFARLGATEAKRKKEADGLSTLTTEATLGTSRIFDSNGNANGSVIAGSNLNPNILLTAKRDMGVGSDREVADYVLCHPIQYQQLNSHLDFAPGATLRGAMLRKAKFNDDGDIVRFHGMDIFVTEQMPSVTGSATTSYEVDGHPVVVGVKGKSLARGQHYGIRVSTEDSRRRHGQWKIFDVSYAHDLLVVEALRLIRCADT